MQLNSWSRARVGDLSAAMKIAVAAAIAMLALTLIADSTAQGRPPAGTGQIASIPTGPSQPNFTPATFRLIQAAYRATVVRDHACSTSVKSLPVLATGSPPRDLTSILGVLRRPATGADRLPGLTGPGGGLGSGVREVYVKDIRRLSVISGTSYYLIPVGNVTGFRPVPRRCSAEQAAALTRALAHSSARRRDRLLGVQARYLRWQRYQAAHPAGVCSAETVSSGGGFSDELISCGYTVTDIELGRAEGWDGSAPDGVFDGLVPDGVAAVAAHYPTPHSAALIATVANNFFAFVDPPWPSTSIPTLTWLDAHGRQIKTAPGFGG